MLASGAPEVYSIAEAAVGFCRSGCAGVGSNLVQLVGRVVSAALNKVDIEGASYL
jgi:hypothetical protein